MIFGSTIILGTFITTLIGLLYFGFTIYFIGIFIVGILVSGLINLPNMLLNFIGLKLIYIRSKRKKDLNNGFVILWLLNNVSLFFAVCIVTWYFGIFDIKDNLLLSSFFLPYSFVSLYFIFKVNREQDEKEFVNIEDKQIEMEDILDADL